jgi:hypothetical protein
MYDKNSVVKVNFDKVTVWIYTVEPRYSAIEKAKKIRIKSKFALYRGQF